MRFLSVNRNLLSKSRIFSFSPAGLGRKTLVRTPGVVGDLKPINKSMLLIRRCNMFPMSKSVTYSLLWSELKSWKLDDVDVPFSDAPFSVHEQDGYCVIGGNGLALFLVLLYQQDHIRNQVKEALWNPKTNKMISIPRSHCIPSLQGYKCSEEEFLGFDPVSQDYKVIKFLKFQDDQYPTLVQLYSLKTDSWKEITFPHSCGPSYHHSVYINGVVYWTPYWDCLIYSFDFANEKFSSAPHIPLPETIFPIVYADRKSWLFDGFILVEFYGLLAAVLHSERNFKTDIPSLRRIKKPYEFEIWVWNDESWSKVVSKIALDGVSEVLGLFNNETLILQGLEGELLLFNWKTRVLENINIDAGISSQFNVLHYVPM